MFKTSTKVVERPAIPDVTRDPRYLQADTTLTQLRARYDALDRRIQGRHDALAAPADDRVRRLLADASATVPRGDSPEDGLAVLHDERRVLMAAVAEQERVRTQVQRALSGEICQRALAYHRQLAGRLAAALQELAAVQQEIDAWQQELDDAGLQWTPHLRPLAFRTRGLRGLENPVDAESVAVHVADLREHELLDR